MQISGSRGPAAGGNRQSRGRGHRPTPAPAWAWPRLYPSPGLDSNPELDSTPVHKKQPHSPVHPFSPTQPLASGEGDSRGRATPPLTALTSGGQGLVSYSSILNPPHPPPLQVPEEVWQRLAGSLPPTVKAAPRAAAGHQAGSGRPDSPHPHPGLGGPAAPWSCHPLLGPLVCLLGSPKATVVGPTGQGLG